MTRTRLLLPLLAALALATAACGGQADSGQVAPDEPVSETAPPAAGACLEGAEDCQDTGGDMGAPPPSDLPADGATEVEPTDGLEDVRAVGWQEVEVAPQDPTSMTVRWTSGVAPCNALSEVQVDYGDEAVTVTVLEGTVPSDEPQACIEIAQVKRTTITLDEELGPRSILDGAE